MISLGAKTRNGGPQNPAPRLTYPREPCPDRGQWPRLRLPNLRGAVGDVSDVTHDVRVEFVDAVDHPRGPARAVDRPEVGVGDDRDLQAVETVAQPPDSDVEASRARSPHRLGIIPPEQDDHHGDDRTGDLVVLTCGALGGVRRSLRLAETFDVPCVVASGRETSVGLAAAVALAGVLPELLFAAEVGRPPWVMGDVVTVGRSLVPMDGSLPVAPMPPAPDPELLARYAVTDDDTIEQWRLRLRRALAAVSSNGSAG